MINAQRIGHALLICAYFMGSMAYATTDVNIPNIHDAMQSTPAEESVNIEELELRDNTQMSGTISVEPIAIIGLHSLFASDFSAAIEAMSIANYDSPVLYPVYVSAPTQNIAEFHAGPENQEFLKKYQWSKLLINENDYVLRSSLHASFESVMDLKTLSTELNTELILVQAPERNYRDFKNFADRDDIALKNGRSIAKLANLHFIPLAHLLSRLEQNDNIQIAQEDKKQLSIEGLWASAAIIYIGLENKRPANPNFSRLYPELQELMEPFATIDVERRLTIIDAAWEEYKRYNRIKN